jgi:hypothetical protein
VVLWTSPALAQEAAGGVAEKASTGREHVVRKGDTLWDLAKLYLSNPFLWGLIHEANRGVVGNPHLIYPQNRLLIPDGSLLAAPDGAQEAVAGGAPFDPAGAGFAGDGVERTLFYQHGSAGVSSADNGVPVLVEGNAAELAAVQPGEFLAAPWLADLSRLSVVGSVVRIQGHGTDRDKVSQSVHPRDRIYLQPKGRAPEVGDRLLLVREGRRLRGWGRVVLPGGIGVVEEVSKEVVLVAIEQQFGPVGPGDLALPLVPFPEVRGFAEPVEDGASATLLGFVEDQPVYDLSDLGFVDLGERSGVAIGDEFEVYLPERSAGGWSAPRLPQEVVARLRVVRVDERTATVRPVRMSQSTLRAGLPVRLVGKMP